MLHPGVSHVEAARLQLVFVGRVPNAGANHAGSLGLAAFGSAGAEVFVCGQDHISIACFMAMV